MKMRKIVFVSEEDIGETDVLDMIEEAFKVQSEEAEKLGIIKRFSLCVEVTQVPLTKN